MASCLDHTITHYGFNIISHMSIIKHNPAEVFPPYQSYAHAVEVRGNMRLLFISGLNGFLSDGITMPAAFEEQGDLIWQHIGTLLRAAGMDYGNLVSLRTYLASPEYDEANVKLRVKYLGASRVAGTVICCRLLETKWKLEIEAVAATTDA